MARTRKRTRTRKARMTYKVVFKKRNGGQFTKRFKTQTTARRACKAWRAARGKCSNPKKI